MEPTPPTLPSIDLVKAKRLSQIDAERKKAEKEVEDLKAERAVLEAELLLQFEQSGVDSVKVDGRLIYIRREVWPKAKLKNDDGTPNTHAIVEGLKRAHWSDLLKETYNSQQLAAFFREREEQGVKPLIPPSLEECLELSEKFSIRSKKA